MTPPRCDRCDDTGECVVDETPTSVCLKPEYGPCSCAAGLALQAIRLQAGDRVLAIRHPPSLGPISPCGGDQL